MKSLKNPTFFLHSKWGLHAINGGLTARQKDHNFTNKKFYPDKSVEYLQFCTTTTYLNGMTLKDRRGDQRGVNGSQSKFLTEFGLYLKINPNPLNKITTSS
jgi:hypothetical protein